MPLCKIARKLPNVSIRAWNSSAPYSMMNSLTSFQSLLSERFSTVDNRVVPLCLIQNPEYRRRFR